MLNLSRKQVSLILTILALVIWSFSITQAEFQIGKYGLIGSFPIIYFVALGLLTIASAILWTSEENHWILLLTQLCFLIISLWLIPVIIGGFEPNNQDIFRYLSEPTDYIVKFGHLNLGTVWYHSWPGYSLFIASMLQFSGVSFSPEVIYLSAFIVQIVTIPIWYYLFRNIVPEYRVNITWACLWLFYLGSWTGESRLSPQYFALFLLFVVFIVLFKNRNSYEDNYRVSYGLILVLISSVLIMTHGMTSFAALLAIFIMYLTKQILSWKFVFLFALIFVAWTVLISTPEMAIRLPQLLRTALNLDLIYDQSIGARITGNADHVAVNQIRIIMSIIFFFIAGLGIVISFLKRKKKEYFGKNERFLDSSFFIIVVSIVLLFPFFLYAGQLLIRIFLLLLIPISYFAVKLLKLKFGIVILTISLLIVLPLHFIAHYGNQRINYISDEEFSSAQYVQQNAVDYYLTGSLLSASTDYPQFKLDRGWKASLDDLSWDEQGNLKRIYGMYNDWPNIIVIDQRVRDWYSYSLNDNSTINKIREALDNTSNCSLVFNNPQVDLYVQLKNVTR
jgi:hypothetical protein